MKLISWFKENYWLAIILTVAAILRIYHVDYQSVWLDEVHTINESNPTLSLSEMYNLLLIAEPHPPLYFLIMHFAFVLFGYTTFVLRFISAIIGIAGVFSIYVFGKEIFNKKVGIYAAILITVNYFQLYYSQDGRMYSLLFLTTTLSFTYLIKFIKQPSYKSAIVYAIFSTLMIYSHFFALFALFSQYLILLYFVIRPYNVTRKNFFIYCMVSGLGTLLLYIPSFRLFAKTTEMKSIWIQMPTLDVYTQFFKDFFGQSEMVLFFITILIIVFFIQLFKAQNTDKLQLNPHKEPLVFSFVILFCWLLTTLLLPLVRTYTSLPMLINRYFINIVPAIIIMVAIGLFYIRNEIVRYGILSTIVVFSLTDIIVVKKYYKVKSKTQFREVTQFIIDNNVKKEPVVTSLGWYFPYFLDNDKVKLTIVDRPLQDYVNDMAQDSTKRKAFWYVDAHNRPYAVNETAQKYLDDNFVVENNIDLYDTWTKHYVLKTDAAASTIFDISKYQPLKNVNGDKINFWVDVFEVDAAKVNVAGWAYLDGDSAIDSRIELVLLTNGRAIKINNQKVRRDDITESVQGKFDLGNSGFSSKISLADLTAGEYRVAIYIKNQKTGKDGFVLSDKIFRK